MTTKELRFLYHMFYFSICYLFSFFIVGFLISLLPVYSPIFKSVARDRLAIRPGEHGDID